MNLDRLRGLYGPLTKTQFPDAFIGRNSDDGFAILLKDDSGDWDRTGPEYPTKTEALAVLPAVHARYHGTDGGTPAARHTDQTYAELALAHADAVRHRQTIQEAHGVADTLVRKIGGNGPIPSPALLAAQLVIQLLTYDLMAANEAEQTASDAARDAFNTSKATV